MNKIIGLAVGLSLFIGAGSALADSQVTATADTNSSITPSGVVVVPTGVDQTFTIGVDSGYNIQGVTLDGVSVGAPSSVDFTGIDTDPVNHTIDVTSQPDESVSAPAIGGGGLIYCSGANAPGWNVSLPNGGCGVPFSGTQTFGSVTLTCPWFFPQGCVYKQP